MPTEIKKVMETKDNGITEQIYPETHANAVIGLLAFLQKMLEFLREEVHQVEVVEFL